MKRGHKMLGTALLLALPVTGVAFARGIRIPVNPPVSDQRATLVCRMGGEMVWSTFSQVGTETTQINGKTVRIPIIKALFAQLVFKRSNVPVKSDGSNLQAGACGWTDRAMTAEEPGKVIEDADDFVIQKTVIWGNGSTLRDAMNFTASRLQFPNKAVFSMEVDRTAKDQFKVLDGTQSRLVSPK